MTVGYHFYFLDKILGAMGLGQFAHEYTFIVHSWFVIAILVGSALLFVKALKMIPYGGQNVFEAIVGGLEDFMVGVAGPGGRFFFPFIGTLFLYILTCNLLGLVPGFFSPTANLNTTLSLALCTFIYTHIIGFKLHGSKYLKHFLGPVWWMVPLMLPLELIGHCARVMSLSIRLFGNIFGKETVIGIFFLLGGLYLAPLPLLLLGILVSFIQALVFMLLSIIYFAAAMEEPH